MILRFAATLFLAAASRWGRRLAFAALATVAAALPAGAEGPAAADLSEAGLLTIPESCRASREEMQIPPQQGIRLDKIADGVWIAAVICERHAYQETSVLLRIERDGASYRSTLLAIPKRHQPEGTPWPLLAYQPWLTGLTSEISDRGELGLYYKGRGLGDCGEIATFDLRAPVVRAREYYAKPECDGEGVDPDTWPALPQATLDRYAPAFRGQAAADLLMMLFYRLPEVHWLAHAIVRADLTGDGRGEQWIGGFAGGWGEPLVYHLIMEQGADLSFWTFAVGTGDRTALCQPAADLSSAQNGTVLVIDDKVCDRLQVRWRTEGGTIEIER